MKPVSVFACSHREGGNTAAAARLFARELAREAGLETEVLALNTFTVRHCQACNACLSHPRHACVLRELDHAEMLFERFLAAPAVVLASPIYFYHLPSMLKTLIDRGQRFWAAREKGDPAILQLPRRPAWAVLAAARPCGERLFDGALLTLKRFLFYFNIEMQEPLTLRGLDGPEEFEASRQAQDKVRDKARAAARRLGGGA